ncbi:MAG: DUF4349 domain-containing protein [Elainellaceae cyanobacterium]
MSGFARIQIGSIVMASVLGSMLVGCSASMRQLQSSVDHADMSATEEAAIAPEANQNQAPSASDDAEPTADVPRSRPQLIKRAELAIRVESVEQSIEQARAIAQQQQGDVVQLRDQLPSRAAAPQTASLTLRIPQLNLDAALTALSDLGQLQQQTITTEDVSNQLVDYQARLRNLRKQEELLLDIMERSGGVGDVLQVARELSSVRSTIEQIDAQLSDLQDRVAYSTITISLEGAIASNDSELKLTHQLQTTWVHATQSVGDFTVDLMQLGIWLMVYSPYWLLLGGFGILAHLGLKHLNNASHTDANQVRSDE